MLDVHPPHHAANTWRDFFIHIATIVVGLLIAIGLEQAVEYVHHRHQVSETREAIAEERALNEKIAAGDVVRFRREVAALQNNLLVLKALQDNPHISRSALPGILTWHSDLQMPFHHAAWTTAHQTNVLELMPPEEVRRLSLLYEYQDRLLTLANEEYVALGEVRFYATSEPDPTHWSPAQVATIIDRTHSILMRLYLFGDTLGNLNLEFPEFGANLDADLNEVLRLSESEDAPEVKQARAATIARINAAGMAHDYFPQK